MRFLSFSTILLAIPALAAASSSDQIVMNSPHDNESPTVNSGKPSLADLLTLQSRASIFYSYARETEYSALFSDEDAVSERNTMSLFVPTNKAVMALARKPHQGPATAGQVSDIKITEAEYDRQSKQNVMNWVAAHIVPQSITFPDSSEETVQVETLLASKSITIKNTGSKEKLAWANVVLEDSIRIIDMKEASNGVLYIIDETIGVPE